MRVACIKGNRHETILSGVCCLRRSYSGQRHCGLEYLSRSTTKRPTSLIANTRAEHSTTMPDARAVRFDFVCVCFYESHGRVCGVGGDRNFY